MRQKRLILILTLITAFLSAIFLSWTKLDYTYELEGTRYPVDLTQISNLSDASFDVNTGEYQVRGEDPNFELPGISFPIDGFEIELKNGGSQDLVFETFFTEDLEKGFAATKKSRGVVKRFCNSGIVRVPRTQNFSEGGFRLDIDDDCYITGIQAFQGKISKNYSINSDFVISVVSIFLLLFVSAWVLIIPAHRERIVRTKSAVLSLFTDDTNTGRPHFYEYDWMRISASFFVIMCHAVSYELDPAKMSGGRGAIILKNIYLLGLCCNMLYVLLSGALLLQPKKEKLHSFYLHRMGKILLPLLVYYTIFSYMNGYFKDGILAGIWSTAMQAVQGAPNYAPNFWLVYVLLGLYVFAPFLRVMLANMSEKQLGALAAIIFILNIFESYLPKFGMNFGLVTPLTGWIGAFIFGYFLTTNLAKKYDRVFLAGGVLGIAMQLGMATFAPAQANEAAGCLTTTYLLAVGLFVLFRHFPSVFGKKSVFIAFLSKYSYSVILIHWYVYFVQVQGVYDFDNRFVHLTAAYVSGVLLTLVICYGFAFLFDNTCLLGIQYAYEKIVGKITKK